MSDHSVWLVGPIGWGINLFVESYPIEDQGCFCTGYQRSIVWDCAIVSKLLNPRISSYLIGNHLGSSSEGNEARVWLTSRECMLFEVGVEQESPSVDIVINSRNTSRTWFSNIKPPQTNLLVTKLRQLETLRSPDILYTDHWFSESDSSIQPYISFINDSNLPLVYYNIGDSSDAQTLIQLTKLLSVPTIFQVSLNNSTELSNLRNTIHLNEKQIVIITRGGEDVYILKNDSLVSIPVRKLQSVYTVGAGAVLSAAIINYLIQNLLNWSNIIEDAVAYSITCVSQILQLSMVDRPYIF